MVETYCHVACTWHTLSPLLNNTALLIGGRPITAPQWEQRGVHYPKDIFSEAGLLPFSDLVVDCRVVECENAFSLPRSSFFFYLQLRHYGVPWQRSLPIHPIRKLFTMQPKTCGMVSRLYQFLVIYVRSGLPIERVWKRDCPVLNTDLDWHDVWFNIPKYHAIQTISRFTTISFIGHISPLWKCIRWK